MMKLKIIKISFEHKAIEIKKIEDKILEDTRECANDFDDCDDLVRRRGRKRFKSVSNATNQIIKKLILIEAL